MLPEKIDKNSSKIGLSFAAKLNQHDEKIVNLYARRRGYVIVSVCLPVRLSVNTIIQQILSKIL